MTTTVTSTHDPIVEHYRGSLEQPEEITVLCTCGDWSYEDQASASGGCDTHWEPWREQHVEDAEQEAEG